jgi:MFS family permease
MLYLATSNAICQLASAPEMRGRVMGVYTMILVGSTPVGAMLVGLVDQELGARWGLAVGGVPAIIAAVALGTSLARRRDLGTWLKAPARLSGRRSRAGS